MDVKIIKAFHGDSILVSYDNDGIVKNILIDGGPSHAWEKTRPRRKKGELKKIIENLESNNQKIDLLIMTHVDDDHIDGILKWFEDPNFNKKMISNVWFNSGQLINEYFNSNHKNPNFIELNIYESPNTSIRQGVKFEEVISELGIWQRKIIKNVEEFEMLDAKLTVLSPSDTGLAKLLSKWEKESPLTETSSTANDYHLTINELLSNDYFSEDKAEHNGSSIAFILEVKNKKVMFLGDAFPSVIVQSLLKLGYSQDFPLILDAVKVSHHGSKKNTSNELLDLIACDKFIVSTNGAKHGLPNKRTLARIINKKPKCEIYFNYPHLIEKIFLEKDKEEFKFTVMDTKYFTI